MAQRGVVWWVGERVLGVTRAIERQCVEVEGFAVASHLSSTGNEEVWWLWERDVVFCASPSFARVVRLWRQGRSFFYLLALARRLGLWRIRGGEYLHCGWWSWPYRAVDQSAWTPAERGYWTWWKQVRTWP